MTIDVLGPLRIDGDDAQLQRRDQVVLAALVVGRGESTPADRLADALWGSSPPNTWPKQVQGSIARLRRVLGVAAIQTTTTGYRLIVDGTALDSERFERLIERGDTLAANGEPDRAAVALGRALALWRAEPFDVLDSWSTGCIEIARLNELRLGAQEHLLDVRLRLGEHQSVVASAEALVAAQPLREHRWAVLALAFYRCGRQADALRSLKQARRMLRDQLGIDPGPELTRIERQILAQDGELLALPEPPAIAASCPYKGLAAYDIEDADSFFGRDADVAACMARLQSHPVLAVTGPSGCGKSSLVRAGVCPALRAAGLASAIFAPGEDPLGAMTAAIAACDAPAVLVVDQFEEALVAGDAERATLRRFCARLGDYATSVAPVVIVVRADQVGALAEDDGFARLVERGMHLVATLGGDALRRAIEGPADRVGLRLEAGLVDLLVRDTEGQPGALPLLSHALAETWQRRDGRVLTVEAYRATGEIRGAVARSADRLYESLPVEQRPQLRSLLLRLVAPSPDGEPVRARIATRTLTGDDRQRLLSLLVRARLVIAEEDTVELAHEALARAWPRLRSWLDEDAAGLRALRHLAAAADGWESLGRPTEELYRGARLEAALEWRSAATPDLTVWEQAFLAASQAGAARERDVIVAQARAEKRQNQRLRRTLCGVVVLLVAAVSGGLVAYQQRQSAEREQRTAALTALTSNAAALRSTRRDLAALLAVEAHRLAPGAATESALFGVFTAAPGLTSTMRLGVDVPTVAADIAIAPGSGTIAIFDGTLSLLDPATGALRRTAGADGPQSFTDMVVSADGTSAVGIWSSLEPGPSGAVTTEFVVWDMATGEPRLGPVSIQHAPGGVAVNGNASLVAVTDATSEQAMVYDATTGSRRFVVDGLRRPSTVAGTSLVPVAFAATGELLVGSSAGPLRIIDPTTGAERSRVDAPAFTANDSIWLGPDGSELVATGYDRAAGLYTVSRIDLDSSLMTGSTQPFTAPCNLWTYAARLDAMLCGTWDGRVLAYDVATGVELSAGFDSQQGPVCGLAVGADGMQLVELTSCEAAEAVVLSWRLDGGGPVSRLVVDSSEPGVNAAGYGYAGGEAALVAEFADPSDGEFATVAIDPATGTTIDRFVGVFALLPTAVPDEVVAVYPDNRLSLYDLVARQPSGPLVDPGVVPDMMWRWGDRLVVGDGYGDGGTTLQGVDLTNGDLVGPHIRLEGAEILDAVVIGQVLHTVELGREFSIVPRDPETGRVVGEPVTGYRNIGAGGGVVIATTVDGKIFEVDPTTLEPIGAPFPGTMGAVSTIAIDRSGRRLMVRGDDETLRIFDIPSRTPLGDPIDLDQFFMDGSAVLRPDGLEVSAETDEGIVAWSLDPDLWVDGACAIAGRNLTPAEWEQFIGPLAPYQRTCPQLPSG